MSRSDSPRNKPKFGSRVRVYVAGEREKITLTVPVATPAAIRRALKLSPASKRRVERAMIQAGLRRKAG